MYGIFMTFQNEEWKIRLFNLWWSVPRSVPKAELHPWLWIHGQYGISMAYSKLFTNQWRKCNPWFTYTELHQDTPPPPPPPPPPPAGLFNQTTQFFKKKNGQQFGGDFVIFIFCEKIFIFWLKLHYDYLNQWWPGYVWHHVAYYSVVVYIYVVYHCVTLSRILKWNEKHQKICYNRPNLCLYVYPVDPRPKRSLFW